MTKKTELDPLEYFQDLKTKKRKWNTEKLKLLLNNTEKLLTKAYKLNQEEVCRKLLFNLDVIQKEKKVFDLGIDTFIYSEDILEYINDISNKEVKIIELKKFPREIPDNISNKILELKEKKIFDDFLIVFTDYTGEVEKQVEKERRRKDPIIFGIFTKDKNFCNRCYFIADWEDEYCDLTLERMIGEMAEEGINIKHSVEQNIELDDIRSYINSLDEKNKVLMNRISRKPSFFEKVRLWLKK